MSVSVKATGPVPRCWGGFIWAWSEGARNASRSTTIGVYGAQNGNPASYFDTPIEFDPVGGPAYIASLVDGVPLSTNVEAYAANVNEKAQLRALIGALEKSTASQGLLAVQPNEPDLYGYVDRDGDGLVSDVEVQEFTELARTIGFSQRFSRSLLALQVGITLAEAQRAPRPEAVIHLGACSATTPKTRTPSSGWTWCPRWPTPNRASWPRVCWRRCRPPCRPSAVDRRRPSTRAPPSRRIGGRPRTLSVVEVLEKFVTP